MRNRNEYVSLSKTCVVNKESYVFLASAVEGPMVVPSQGLRAGLPIRHPIYVEGELREPSPLNSNGKFMLPSTGNSEGIL